MTKAVLEVHLVLKQKCGKLSSCSIYINMRPIKHLSKKREVFWLPDRHKNDGRAFVKHSGLKEGL